MFGLPIIMCLRDRDKHQKYMDTCMEIGLPYNPFEYVTWKEAFANEHRDIIRSIVKEMDEELAVLN